MAVIEAHDVGVSYQIYNAKTRSLKGELFRRVGGRISVDAQSRVSVQALQNVNLVLAEGDRVALIGGNGAGKSTLLRVLAGILEPSAGQIFRSGTVSSLLDMSMGMDPEATGYENIIMRCIVLGATFAEAKERVHEIEHLSGLGEYLHFPLRTYSTGMHLRLSFAIATAIQPEILILDEMIGTGDADFTAKAKKRLDNFVSGSKILVLATHNFATAKDFCNRGVVMKQGQIVVDCDISDAISFYSNVNK